MGEAAREATGRDAAAGSIAIETGLARATVPRGRLLAAVVVAAATLPYLNTLAGGFVFDDHSVVVTDPAALASWSWLLPRTVVGSLYRPVTAFTYAVEAALGVGPAVRHVVSVAIHAGASLAAFGLARRLLARPWHAAIVATLFAVHPVHTEAVANLAGRAELLAGLFVFVASWAALGGRLGLAFVASLLAAGSKESALTLPLLAAIVVGWRRGRLDRRGLAAVAAVAAPCALWVAARAAVVGAIGFHEAIPFADNPLAHAGVLRRVATALVVLLDYLGALTLPVRLSADDTFDQVPVVAHVADPRLVAAVLALALVAFAAWRGRARVPAVWLGAVFAVAALAVTANLFFPIGTIKAERFLYVPSFGWCLAAGGLASLDRRLGLRVVAAIVLLFALRTWVRNDDWRDDYSLFTATAIASPNSARAQANAGAVHAQRGELDVALDRYTVAVGILPAFVPAQLGRGKVLEIMGRHTEALAAYEAVRASEPGHLEATIRSADVRGATGDPIGAERGYRAALVAQPGHPELLLGLALSRARQGDRREAEALRAQVDPRALGLGSIPVRLRMLESALAR
jgi:protein O-mannosyl-transferase